MSPSKKEALLGEEGSSFLHPYAKGRVGVNEEEDEDVDEERRRVVEKAEMIKASETRVDSPVLVRNLRKVFHVPSGADKVAVNDLCLEIREGECFGLLGEK